LQAGADVDADDGYSLGWASCHDYIEVIKVLLKYGADSNKEGCPLMSAVCSGKIERVKLILKYGAKVNNTEYDNLEIAVERGYMEILKILLNAGADLYAGNCQVLKTAIRENRIDFVKYFLDNYSNLVIHEFDMRDAIDNKQTEIVKMILGYTNVYMNDEYTMRLSNLLNEPDGS
jgi:ankyrin repeat protein